MYVMCTYVVLYGLRKLLTVLFGSHSGALDATVILSDLYNGLIIVSHPTFLFQLGTLGADLVGFNTI